jgi:hypothetical protein
MRVRPVVAMLVDGGDHDAQDDLLVARARRRGIAVLMFGPAAALDARRGWAKEQGVGVIALPDGIPALIGELERLREPEPRSKPRIATRRAHTERDQDGTLIFDDGRTRWSVYDRRGHDDRRSNNTVDRQFVDESGAVLHCDVSEDEAASISVDLLSRQLARAVPLIR